MQSTTNAGLRRYKEPLTPLAGPYGHPYHPLAVTLPIGAFVSSVVFDVMARNSREPQGYARGAADLIKTGIFSAAGAAMFGMLDYLKIPTKTSSAVGLTATAHMTLNATILLLFAIDLNMREKRLHSEEMMREAPVGNVELGLSLLACTLLAASGWLGGKLSYRFGVRVADEQTQTEALKPAMG
jgi:uncharacterized membrane protein